MTTKSGRTRTRNWSGKQRPGSEPVDKSRVVLTCSVDVQASEQQVWDAMTDWDRQGEWMLGTRVRGTTNGGRGVGGGVEAWTGVGPLGFLDTMVITAWEPPNRCEVDHTGRLIRGTGAFLVDSGESGGSVMTWIEDVRVPGGALGRLGWLIVRPAVQFGLRRSLMKLAASVSKPAGGTQQPTQPT
jgi:carbon monoxide dehydrogenase subunit G